jgi:hypothetical protein
MQARFHDLGIAAGTAAASTTFVDPDSSSG